MNKKINNRLPAELHIARDTHAKLKKLCPADKKIHCGFADLIVRLGINAYEQQKEFAGK